MRGVKGEETPGCVRNCLPLRNGMGWVQWRTQEFFRRGGYSWKFWGGGGGLTNSVEDRGQRDWGSGGGSPLVRGSAHFANE
jgi:hypothetical protein